MPFDRRIPPYRLSPKTWQLGQDDIRLLIGIHDGDDDTPEQDERREQRNELFVALADMTAAELRAYIDGMHDILADHFW